MRKQTVLRNNEEFIIDTLKIAKQIADIQHESGEIPWATGQKSDPWDHVEAAMGLVTGGFFKEAEKAFQWLSDIQLDDGSFYSAYINGVPKDFTRETNHAPYVAVGVLHYFLATGDKNILALMWNTIEKAVDFTISMQAKTGVIYWAVNPKGEIDPMALLTGCSSIYMSIKCALYIAFVLGHKKPRWENGLRKLGNAIKNTPWLFNMTKSRYSMDWFYPILSGAITGDMAARRLKKFRKKFIIEGHGVRCVSDRPWITIAETSELCIALNVMGNKPFSKIIFSWICDKRYDDGTYWCGYTYPDMTIWPEEKLTWTNAAVLMALDAIFELTPACVLFSHKFRGNHEKRGMLL